MKSLFPKQRHASRSDCPIGDRVDVFSPKRSGMSCSASKSAAATATRLKGKQAMGGGRHDTKYPGECKHNGGRCQKRSTVAAGNDTMGMNR